MKTRREMLQNSLAVTGLLAGIGMFPRYAQAFDKAAFDAKNMAELAKALGSNAPQESAAVTLTAPDIAENGAVVPMTIATSMPNVKKLLLVVEKNPSVLIAQYNLTPEVIPSYQTRAKMGQSSDVYAIAITNDNKAFFAKKEVKVTLGGCGG